MSIQFTFNRLLIECIHIALLLIFLDQELISYRYLSCSSCSCWGEHLQKSLSSIVSNRIRVKFDKSVHAVTLHRLTESDFFYRMSIRLRWRTWRHFVLKSVTIWWVHMQRLLGWYAAAYLLFYAEKHHHLVHAHAASAWCICSNVCQLPESSHQATWQRADSTLDHDHSIVWTVHQYSICQACIPPPGTLCQEQLLMTHQGHFSLC